MVDYNPFAKTFSKSRKHMKWAELDEIIADIKRQKLQTIVDIGCGNGRFVEQYLANVGEEPENYTGVDSSEILIFEAKKLFPNQQFIVSTMQEFLAKLSTLNVDIVQEKNSEKKSENSEEIIIAKSPIKFDTIVFLASFHHLESEEERIQVLTNAKKILSKNGRIYMTNWNLLSQEKYKNSHTGNGDFMIKIWEYSRYYHGFSLDELNHIFKKADLSIVKNEIFEWGRNIYSVLSH